MSLDLGARKYELLHCWQRGVKEDSLVPAFEKVLILYHPACFKALTICREHTKRIYKCTVFYTRTDMWFRWAHKLALSCWCMLLVLTGLFRFYSLYMTCPWSDWGYIILKGKMTHLLDVTFSTLECKTHTQMCHEIINVTVLNVIIDVWH